MGNEKGNDLMAGTTVTGATVLGMAPLLSSEPQTF